MKSQRRPQAKKVLITGRNPQFAEAMRGKRELTRPSGNVYKRKPKHREW